MTARTARFYLAALAAGFGLMLAGRAEAQTVYTPFSNLGQPAANVFQVGEGAEAGVSFTTEGNTNSLVSVSIRLTSFGVGSLGPFILSLCSNAGGSPGGVLATLSGNSYPTNAGVYIYTNSSALMLSSNTTYWLVASSPASVSGHYYVWTYATTTNLDSGSFWPLGVSEYNFGSWDVNSSAYLQFSITVATANLPALSISQAMVLACPTTPGLPLILQESPVLPGSNWVTVTNAIQAVGVKTNQTFFIVPPTGQQMYFRVGLP